MAKQVTINTVLQGAEFTLGEHRLLEQPLCGKLNLRGNPDDPAFVQAVERTLGLAPPLEANRVAAAEDHKLFWLGPDEWLAHLPLEQVDDKLQQLQQALAGQHSAVTEVSDYYAIIELQGPQAREVIASGSPLDIRPQQFAPGQCAQTRFGHASILLWPLPDAQDDQAAPAFCLQVRWTYAHYLFDYLQQSIQNCEALKTLGQP